MNGELIGIKKDKKNLVKTFRSLNLYELHLEFTNEKSRSFVNSRGPVVQKPGINAGPR